MTDIAQICWFDWSWHTVLTFGKDNWLFNNSCQAMINRRKGALSAGFLFYSFTLCFSSVVKGCSLQLQPSQIKAFFYSLHMPFNIIIDMLQDIADDIQNLLMSLTELTDWTTIIFFWLAWPSWGHKTGLGDVCWITFETSPMLMTEPLIINSLQGFLFAVFKCCQKVTVTAKNHYYPTLCLWDLSIQSYQRRKIWLVTTKHWGQ